MQGVNKSIDIVTDKLTKVLAFGGVLLKFGSDMPSARYFLILKSLVIFCGIASVILCAVGLWPRQVKVGAPLPQYLLETSYDLDEEMVYLQVAKTWQSSLPALEGLRSRRITFLNYAIAALVCAGVIFGLSGILTAFSIS